MAYEASEIMTATALLYTSRQLRNFKTYEDLTGIIDAATMEYKEGSNINKGPVQFANGKIEAGFLKKLDYKSLDKSKQIKRIADMAVGVSAALAIRELMGAPSAAITTYMTGNQWPTDVEKFQVSVPGFKDYNSSDIVVKKNASKSDFFGISLKKKPTVKSDDPTLINKAFSGAFQVRKEDNKKLYDLMYKGESGEAGLLEQLVDARQNYFADIVIEAVEEKKIIAKQDIKKFDTLKKTKTGRLELFEAKNKSDKFDKKRAYIDTKGWALADKGYLEDKTTDPNSMRYFVNKKLSEKPNQLWNSFVNIIDKGSEELANHLINIILKTNINKELDAKDLKSDSGIPLNFTFALVTGIGNISPKLDVSIAKAKLTTLKTTLCGLKRIDEKNKGPYSVVQDTEATQKSNAAKIFFKLKKGDMSLLNLEVRYKGSFTPEPQFQGGMTQAFKTILDKECSGGPG